MRHIRDPVTGRCLVCEQGKGPHVHHSHGSPSPNPNSPPPRDKASWDDVRKKVIYVNAFNPNRSNSPHDRFRNPRHRDYDNDSGISGNTTASASKVHIIHHQQPMAYRDPSPVTRSVRHHRDPSPPPPMRRDDRSYRDRDRYRDRSYSPDPGCCGRQNRTSRKDQFGHNNRNLDHGWHNKRGVAAASHRSTMYNGHASNWGRRRCCACMLGILLLLLLAALAVGLYFGITELMTQQQQQLPENRYPGGYYIDGVYVIPVTERPGETYLILGTDQPCNDGFIINSNWPNCADVTIRTIVSNITTTPNPALVVVVATTAAISSFIAPSINLLCISMAAFLFIIYANKY